MMTPPTDPNWLDDAIHALAQVRVGVFGDFCVDAYWHIDPDASEISIETALPVRRVQRQNYTLGGAANVAANLAALRVARLVTVGMVGDDLFGRELLNMLRTIGADATDMLNIQPDWQTPVYAKPHVTDVEENRIDFGGFNQLSHHSIDALADALDHAASHCDVIVLNQQVPAGISPPAMIQRINQIVDAHPDCRFIVDARDRPGLYRGVSMKLNAHEAATLSGDPRSPDDAIPPSDVHAMAQAIHAERKQPIYITRGEHGIVAADDAGVHTVPGIAVTGPTDPVGAGDTALAALAAALGAKLDTLTAATLANIAASITVTQQRTTGTATPDDLRRVGPTPEYIHFPLLADDPALARRWRHTTIEIIREPPTNLRIDHAVFDHDGTLSTLRHGWAEALESMMVRTILGPRLNDADGALRQRITTTTRQFIEYTTGAQTLIQMHGLVDLVHQFGLVPPADVLGAAEYKKRYNVELMKLVNRRLDQIRRGEKHPNDFRISGSLPLLQALHDRDVELSLASGTDQPDAVAEAEALEYAHLFESRIVGAIGDVHFDPKQVVLDQALGADTNATDRFVTFGDGPVEIRRARQRGGYAVGIASDEEHAAGPDLAKRRRLIRAGADAIISDFTDLDALLRLLNLDR